MKDWQWALVICFLLWLSFLFPWFCLFLLALSYVLFWMEWTEGDPWGVKILCLFGGLIIISYYVGKKILIASVILILLFGGGDDGDTLPMFWWRG